ncbi:Hydrogenase maturation factor HybF [Anaerolineae bacterium]|nr:Hydrogenase maturation factor HybF [Anaerolineae bacterium]
MHELSLCESILEVLEQQAKQQHFKTVKTVCLEIGKLSCVEVDALRFCFSSVMENTLASSATLEIIEIDGKAWCKSCQQTVNITQRYDECPQCGAYPLNINDGEQMRIKELEVL